MRPHSNRGRAPSDPFLDSNTASSLTIHASKSSLSEGMGAVRGTEGGLKGPTPPSNSQINSLLLQSANGDHTPSLIPEANEQTDFHRVWTLPDLSNPEFLTLISSFPSFLTRRALPRFPVDSGRRNSSNRNSDVESGGNLPDDREVLRIGTGSLWIGAQLRTGAWQGSWWERFIAWWRRLFR